MAAPNSALWTTNATGDGATGGYTQAEWIEIFRHLFGALQSATNGVLDLSSGTDLLVSGTASPVSVAAGAAVVYGTVFWDGSATTIAISTPVVGTKGFRIVLRASWAAETVRATLIESADGVAAIPAAVQSAGTTWDLSLATGTITTGGVIALTDVRGFIHFPTRIDRSKIDGGASARVPFNDASGLLTDSGGFTYDDTNKRARVQGVAPGLWLDETDDATKGLLAVLINGALELRKTATNFGATETTPFKLDYVNGQETITPASALPPLIIGSNGQGQRNVGLVAEPGGTLGLRRQGGDANDWSAVGNTNQTVPTLNASRDQMGVKSVSILAGQTIGSGTVTFPTAFSDKPMVFLQPSDVSAVVEVFVTPSNIATNQFIIRISKLSSAVGFDVAYTIQWFARGPQ